MTNNKIHLPSLKQAISPSVSYAPRNQKRGGKGKHNNHGICL